MPAAMDRAAEALVGMSGAHHMFVFMAPNCLERDPYSRWVRGLAEQLEESRTRMHVFIPEGVDYFELTESFRKVPGCTIYDCTLETLPAKVEAIGSAMLHNFEIHYAPTGEPQPGELTFCGSCGRGSVEFLPE